MEARHTASKPQGPIRGARQLTAFTGAGISVESSIPPFRAHPDRSWPLLREIFYGGMGQAKRNRAHEVLAA